MTLPVAILAGGLATRLRNVTSGKLPKALIELHGQPFLAYQLRWLHSQGVELAVLCVGHMGGMIEARIGDGSHYGLRLLYSYDGETLLGTGGAIRKALPLLGPQFAVMYGDSYLACSIPDVEQAFAVSGKDALMTVFRNEGKWNPSNVLFRADGTVRYDKRSPSPDMAHIDYGLSVLRSSAFAKFSAGPAFDLADLLSSLSLEGRLGALEVHERFYEIGSPEGLDELRIHLAQ